MAVHIHNISLVLMNNNFEPNWLLHATASELHLDGSIVHNTKSLIVTAALNDAQVNDFTERITGRTCNLILHFNFAGENVATESSREK